MNAPPVAQASAIDSKVGIGVSGWGVMCMNTMKKKTDMPPKPRAARK